jgi:integrase
VPIVLSQEELQHFFSVIQNKKHLAMFKTLYGAGLRASELISLRVEDIDSSRMLLRIREGKGQKQRYAKLSTHLLEVLREYYKDYRPSEWLFAGRRVGEPLNRMTLNRVLAYLILRAALKKNVTPHTFRHSYASGSNPGQHYTYSMRGGTVHDDPWPATSDPWHSLQFTSLPRVRALQANC